MKNGIVKNAADISALVTGILNDSVQNGICVGNVCRKNVRQSSIENCVAPEGRRVMCYLIFMSSGFAVSQSALTVRVEVSLSYE